MTRFVAVLLLVVCALSAGAKQTHTQRAHSKSKQPYCAVTTIADCSDQGCGKNNEPKLNERKNIRSDNRQPENQTIAWMKSLSDPENFTDVNQDRSELTQIGEGKKIRVVAWVLDVRTEGQETCNCGLTAPKDTDNHLVLVDPSIEEPTLKGDEPHSITAE